MSGFERITQFDPAYDRRDEGYGVHGVDLRMILVGELGAVQFVLSTGWPHPSSIGLGTPDPYGDWMHRYQDGFREQNEWDHQGRKCGLYPSAVDLGYHSPTPRYEGQTEMDCHILPGGKCFYDGSGLNASAPFLALVTGGSDAVWEFLEGYYADVFERRDCGEESR